MIIFPYKRIKLWSLFLYFFSQPFLYWDPLGLRGSFTVSAFAFLLYLIIVALKPLQNLNFKYFILPGIALFLLWFLFLFHDVYGISGVYSDSGLNTSFLQIIIMIWLVQSHLYKDESAYFVVWKAVAGACILTAVLISLGIGLVSSSGEEYYGGRLYFFGMNPNQLGNIAALGLVLSFLFILEMAGSLSWLQKALAIITIVCCLYVVAYTASRGAFVVSLFLLLVAFTFSNLKFYKRVITAVTAILTVFISISYFIDVNLILERFTDSSNPGSFGNRTERWEAAFDIFSSSPFFGVGENAYNKITSMNYGFSGSPHNSFLQIMAYGGMLGLFLFLTPILYAARISVAAYSKTKKISPIILLLFFILIMSKDGGALNSAFNWSVLALSIGMALNILGKKEGIQ